MTEQTKNGNDKTTGGLDPFVDLSETRTAEVPWEDKSVAIHYVPVTREVRNKSFWEAVEAFKQDHPNMTEDEFKNSIGFDLATFEREVANAVIKGWSLSKPVSIGWRELPPELGDRIANAVGINEAIQSMRSYNSDATEDARNLSQDGGEA